MNILIGNGWDVTLQDPSNQRKCKPRNSGLTMIIDKGLGTYAFEDFVQTSAEYVDMIKIGFGTSALYTRQMLQLKIEIAKKNRIDICPGGTFFEIAFIQNKLDSYFKTIIDFGFTAIEISDGTIEISRELRNECILYAKERNLKVITEYGKKFWGSKIETKTLIETVCQDKKHGAEYVIIEARESGMGVGLFDENGNCNQTVLENLLTQLNSNDIMWEAPLKNQQLYLIKTIGRHVNLGNISPHDTLSLEALRRGLRSDTFQQSESS